MCKIFSRFDMFGHPIQFYYNGDTHSTTPCAGITSLILVGIVMALLFQTFLSYFTEDTYEINTFRNTETVVKETNTTVGPNKFGGYIFGIVGQDLSN